MRLQAPKRGECQSRLDRIGLTFELIRSVEVPLAIAIENAEFTSAVGVEIWTNIVCRRPDGIGNLIENIDR